jgi:hypothetical protein
MSRNLTRKAAVLVAPLALAVAPVSVNTSPGSATDLFVANEACADEVAGCKPNPGYVCRLDGIHYWDKEPIIIKTEAEAEAQ